MRADGLRRLAQWAGCAAVAAALSSCATAPEVVGATRNQVIISVRDQKLTVIRPDHHRVTFPISTSKFGLGDRRGSLATPLGEMAVAQKIGAGAPPGTVFRSRMKTGEIVGVDAPGRDAIVTRILALKGLEAGNQGAYSRGIYIHGTPEERNIGRPVSYGCIRMRPKDVIQLFDLVGVGAHVQIIDTTMPQALAANIVGPSSAEPSPSASAAPSTLVAQTPAPARAPAATQRKGWAGSPANMLARAAQTEAREKKPRPVGGARPPIPTPNADSAADSGYGSRSLSHSAVDSL